MFLLWQTKKGNGSMLYKLGQDGNEICQSCMKEGHWKPTLEIIEHNKMADAINKKDRTF